MLEKTLESPLDSKEIKPFDPKGNQPWIFIGSPDAEAEAPILQPPNAKSHFIGKDPDAGENWRQNGKGQQKKRWLDSITNSMDTNLSKLQEIVKTRGSWCAEVHEVTKSWIRLESESEVAQSFPTLCDHMDCNLPGFSVLGIFQTRVLEWVAISFSRESSPPRDRTWVSCIAGRRFIIQATREALVIEKQKQQSGDNLFCIYCMDGRNKCGGSLRCRMKARAYSLPSYSAAAYNIEQEGGKGELYSWVASWLTYRIPSINIGCSLVQTEAKPFVQLTGVWEGRKVRRIKKLSSIMSYLTISILMYQKILFYFAPFGKIIRSFPILEKFILAPTWFISNVFKWRVYIQQERTQYIKLQYFPHRKKTRNLIHETVM